MNQTPRHFSEFRISDYRIARSRKELYGWECPLFVPEKPERRIPAWAIWLPCLGLLIWRTYGWL